MGFALDTMKIMKQLSWIIYCGIKHVLSVCLGFHCACRYTQKEKSTWVGWWWRDSQSGWTVCSLSVQLRLLSELMLYKHSCSCSSLISFTFSTTAASPLFSIHFLPFIFFSVIFRICSLTLHTTLYLFTPSIIVNAVADCCCHILPESRATTPILSAYLSQFA